MRGTKRPQPGPFYQSCQTCPGFQPVFYLLRDGGLHNPPGNSPVTRRRDCFCFCVTRLKADYSSLENLNSAIGQLAKQLAAKLDAREHILNHNSFTLENTVHIVDLIDKAAAGNGHYRSRVREPLQSLGTYELKYWPSVQAILRILAEEPRKIGFIHESDRAIVCGRGELVPDYLRELFSHIEIARTCLWGLPEGFRLTDASLANLATVSLDLKEPASIAAVKMHRTRLSKKSFSGAWPVRKKKTAALKAQVG